MSNVDNNQSNNNNNNNMISNLPLLFANGYPTSLDKITEKQLENFIPFMVQCSLGQINNHHYNHNNNNNNRIDQLSSSCNEPEWWPEDIRFTIPFVKPKNFNGNWLNKMKEIVMICYQFHKSVFLLIFCNDLAKLEQASLRFINNYNSTTSLFDRRNNRLLVTFRNENMSYDQPQRNRKSLLTKRSRHDNDGVGVGNDCDVLDNNNDKQLMVQQALFDIYLCDNCDGEFYSYEAIKEHEKTCTPDDDDDEDDTDDDVIICESPTLEMTSQQTERYNEFCKAFLLNFQLQPVKQNNLNEKENHNLNLQQRNKNNNSSSSNSSINNNTKISTQEIDSRPIEKLKRLPRRNRGIYALSRCPTIPLSSPAGQIMIKTSKTLMTEDYLYERLDRMERFCHAPVLANGVTRPKFLDKKFIPSNVQCTYKKLNNTMAMAAGTSSTTMTVIGSLHQQHEQQQQYQPNCHTYVFPRRHFSSKYRTKSFLFLNSLLLKRCRPVTINLKKYTEEQLKQKIENRKKSMKVIRRPGQKQRQVKKSQVIIDTIDLCSSDEENENTNDVHISMQQQIATNKTIVNTVRSSNNRPSISLASSSSSFNLITTAPTTITTNSFINNKSVRTTAINHDENIRNLNKFEGNFLLSQTPKPLQPSVFLFSNYSTDINHHHNHNHLLNHFPIQQQLQQSDKLMQIATNYQNQENLQNNLQNTNDDVIMLSPIATTTPIINNINSNNINNIISSSSSSNNNRIDRNNVIVSSSTSSLSSSLSSFTSIYENI